jgi:hypothetical protein
MRITVCCSAILASLLASLLSAPLSGQSQSASLTGIVTDSSGAAVPKASLRLVNSETGEVFQAASNDSGNYDFPLLKPGRYNLTAELTGFKQVQETGVVLETGLPTRVDVKLEVGAITDSVTVEASAPLVQSDTAAVGSVWCRTRFGWVVSAGSIASRIRSGWSTGRAAWFGLVVCQGR